MENFNKKSILGHDNDSGAIVAIFLLIVVVMIVLLIIFYGGIFIGGFHALKNYIVSFKHNVIDSNRVETSA